MEAAANLESVRTSMVHYLWRSRACSSVRPAVENTPICGAVMPAATKYFGFWDCCAGIGDMAGFNYSIEDKGERESNIQAPATGQGWVNPVGLWGPGGAC